MYVAAVRCLDFDKVLVRWYEFPFCSYRLAHYIGNRKTRAFDAAQ